jgi:hypothetical protein
VGGKLNNRVTRVQTVDDGIPPLDLQMMYLYWYLLVSFIPDILVLAVWIVLPIDTIRILLIV